MPVSVSRFLDTNGDGTGTKNAAVNGSVTPAQFFIQPPPGKSFFIKGLDIRVVDAGLLLPEGYGALAALSTGIQLLRYKPEPVNMLDGVNVVRHYDWLTFSQGRSWADTTGLGVTNNNTFTCHVKFPEAVFLDGGSGDRMAVIISDDLTGLVQHYFRAVGYESVSSH